MILQDSHLFEHLKSQTASVLFLLPSDLNQKGKLLTSLHKPCTEAF